MDRLEMRTGESNFGIFLFTAGLPRSGVGGFLCVIFSICCFSGFSFLRLSVCLCVWPGLAWSGAFFLFSLSLSLVWLAGWLVGLCYYFLLCLCFVRVFVFVCLSVCIGLAIYLPT